MLIKLNNRTIKILLLFLSLFALQMAILFVLLLRPQISSAATIGVRVPPDSMHSNCPCSDKNTTTGTGVTETIRLFIPIPGVTDGCGYLCDINGDKKGDVVDYVVAIYKFLVGAAAIMAVFMIMVGGYQWIFAMGSSSAIESAKDTIKSALFGLLLTLFSYQVLHFINPRLTDVVLPDVEEIGRMQIGGYLCGGDDLLVDYEWFNTMLVGSFAEALKTTNIKLDKTIFYTNHKYKELSDKYWKQPFTIPEEFLIDGFGLNYNTKTYNIKTKDILKCDNTAMSYKIVDASGEPTKNPSGPEVKIAHFNTSEVEDENNKDKKVTKVVGIDCFYGLCDKSDKSLVDVNTALANIGILEKQAEIYAKNNGYELASPIEIYNSVSTRVEPKGGGCYGSFCETQRDGLALCLSKSGIGIDCWNVNQMCKDTDRNFCEQTEQELENYIHTAIGAAKEMPFACVKRQDNYWGTFAPADNCNLGMKFGCPFGYKPIYNYFNYQEAKTDVLIALIRIDDKDMGYVDCWQEGGKGPEPMNCAPKSGLFGLSYAYDNVYPVSIPNSWAVETNSAMCCQRIKDTDTSKFYCMNSWNGVYGDNKGVPNDLACTDVGEICKIKKGYFSSVEVNGICVQKKISSWNTTQAKEENICFPADNDEPYTKYDPENGIFGIKVCHQGEFDKIVHESLDSCAIRNGYYCESYILPADYPCLDLPAAGSFGEDGSGTGDGGTGGVDGAIETLAADGGKIEKLLEDAVDIPDEEPGGLTDLKSQLRGQTIGFLGSEPSLPISSALAATPIDACKFVEAIIAQESGGDQELCPKNDNGTWDCGLMQVNVGACTDSACQSVDSNITAGVMELLSRFNNICTGGGNLSCEEARGSDKFYRYVLAAYNGGDTAISESKCCTSCPATSGTCPEKCGKGQMGCFLDFADPSSIIPTQVECNSNPQQEGWDYCNITYPYVMEKFEKNYQELVKRATEPGVASCP